MPKPKRKANAGVGVDFRRVKHKVGKKLPKAQNETQIDVKARSIALPSQNITHDKGGAPVSERNSTLKVAITAERALLSHTRSARLEGGGGGVGGHAL